MRLGFLGVFAAATWLSLSVASSGVRAHGKPSRFDLEEALPPVPAALPVGIDFLGLPFSEHKVFMIGAAYDGATHNRRTPPDFPPLDD